MIQIFDSENPRIDIKNQEHLEKLEIIFKSTSD